MAGLTRSILPFAEPKHVNKETLTQALKFPAMTGFANHYSFAKHSNWGTLLQPLCMQSVKEMEWITGIHIQEGIVFFDIKQNTKEY